MTDCNLYNQNRPLFNSFSGLQFIPYNIISHLAQDVNAENFWKALYYDNFEALSMTPLTLKQKLDTIWKGDGGKEQSDCNIFLTYQVEDMQTEAKTYMKIYRVDTVPTNNLVATVAYEFDVLFGGKIAMINYEGIPCNRADVIEVELMKSLNGADINGVGYFQFNSELSRMCRSRFNIGNNVNFSGISSIFAVQVSGLNNGQC